MKAEELIVKYGLSKGHVGWGIPGKGEPYEYYEQDGRIYRAPVGCYINLDTGQREGARPFCKVGQQMLLMVLTHPHPAGQAIPCKRCKRDCVKTGAINGPLCVKCWWVRLRKERLRRKAAARREQV